MGYWVRSHREIVKKRSNKIGQTAVIRHRAQPRKCKDWPQFTWLTPFLSGPTLSVPDSLPLHIASSAGIVPLTPFNTLHHQVCNLIGHKVLVHMQFPDSPLVKHDWSGLFLVFVSIKLVWQVCVSLFCLWHPFLPYNPFWQGLQLNNLTEINIPTFHIPSSISDQPGLVLVTASLTFCWSSLCLRMFLFIPLFLIVPF